MRAAPPPRRCRRCRRYRLPRPARCSMLVPPAAERCSKRFNRSQRERICGGNEESANEKKLS
eukprot:206033-Chlamydomonas_euryale.AAC.2